MKTRIIWIVILLPLLVCLMPETLEAQEASIIVRIGEWLVSELGSYALGKVLDKAVERQKYFELANQRDALQQRGANDSDPQLTKAELRSVNSEMAILYYLLQDKVSVKQIDDLKSGIAANNQRLLAVLANHEERLQRLELFAKITGSWECRGLHYHRWFRITPDGTVFCCFVGIGFSWSDTGQIKSGGEVDWQLRDCDGNTGETSIGWRFSRDGADLTLSKGSRMMLCARAAMPDTCNAPPF
jgi:hypothetical protein